MITKSTISQLKEIGSVDASVRDLQTLLLFICMHFRAWGSQGKGWFIHGKANDAILGKVSYLRVFARNKFTHACYSFYLNPVGGWSKLDTLLSLTEPRLI